MASHSYVSDESDAEFHSLSASGDDAGPADNIMSHGYEMVPPVHPVPSFQEPFQESIIDSTTLDSERTYEFDDDAHMRRRKLLHAARYEDVRQTRHKQRRSAKFHPFLKLCSQIVFGMHLLQQQQAKSNEEVVRILQSHVNEVDSLLERTSQDLDLAFTDIKERVRYLRLPMQHMDIFEGMLNDKKFRTDLLLGNEKIEKIIRRTAQALNDSMADVQVGIKSTKELRVYLKRIEPVWPVNDVEIGDVFSAMRGNEQGWLQFLSTIQKRGSDLGNELDNLTKVIAEIARLAGEASRRNKPPPPAPLQIPASQPRVRSKYALESRRKPGPWLDKPLPQEPGAQEEKISVETHPVPFSTRFEQPRQRPPIPAIRVSTIGPARGFEQRALKPVVNATMPQYFRAISTDTYKEFVTLATTNDPLGCHPPSPPNASTNDATRGPTHVSGQRLSVSAAAGHRDFALEALPRRSRMQSDLSALAQKHRRNNSIPRKPVGFGMRKARTPQRSSTIIKYVPKEPPLPAPKELPSINTGFSRRISMKLKNLPPVIKQQPSRQPVAYAVDSAYSSSPDKSRSRSTPSPTDSANDSGKGSSVAPTARDFAAPAQEDKPTERSASRLGLFPKDTGPLTPSQASYRSADYLSPDSKSPRSPQETYSPQNPLLQRPKALRTLSLRKLFHRKEDSQSTMISCI